MSETLTLPAQPHSDTSREAAEKIEKQPKRLSDLHLALLGAYRSAGMRGLTDPECQAYLAMGGSTQRPRRVELARAGKIRKTGERREGCAVWVLA